MSIYLKRWSNRGFLFGPICPIYGFGAVAFTLLLTYVIDPAMALWKIFLIFSLGTAALEYLTSYLLERWFHARWWDYSKAPLNLHGRICLPATLGFGIAGVLFSLYALPLIHQLDGVILNFPLTIELISLIFMMLFSLDIALTLSSLTDLVSRMENFQSDFDGRMEGRYAKIQESSYALASNVKTRIVVAGHSISDRIKNLPGDISFLQRHQLSSIRAFRFRPGRESRVMRALNFVFGRRHKGYVTPEDNTEESKNKSES